MRRFALVVDLGGTKIAAARVDESGKITHRITVPTPPSGGKAVVSAIVETARQLPQHDASALGIDVPGLAYPDGNVWAPNIRDWKRMPLGKLVAKQLSLPIVVESDRNAYVTGEAWQGAARGCRDVVFLAIGTGIGAGIVSGGQLIRGSGELAGSFGWMALNRQFLPEYKRIGCLESHLAGPAIARAATRIRKAETSTHDTIHLARQGDASARKVLAEAGGYLGIALANIVSTLNPQMVVIGGGMAAAGNLLLAPARKVMLQWAQPLAVKQVRIVQSTLGERAALLGMAKIALDKISHI